MPNTPVHSSTTEQQPYNSSLGFVSVCVVSNCMCSAQQDIQSRPRFHAESNNIISMRTHVCKLCQSVFSVYDIGVLVSVRRLYSSSLSMGSCCQSG